MHDACTYDLTSVDYNVSKLNSSLSNMTCLNKDKDPLAFMLFKFSGLVKSACVQETIFMLNFSNLK